MRSEEKQTLKLFASASIAIGIASGFFLLTGFAGDDPQPQQKAASDSRTCVQCHQGIESMHSDGDGEIGITCVGCHGGNGEAAEKNKAHVPPRLKDTFKSSANPKHSYTALNHESPEFIRFMNPGDFRVADKTCGNCHGEILSRMMSSIMTHSALVPQAGLYNNGIHDGKKPVFGEAYMPDGTPAALTTPDELAKKNAAKEIFRTGSLVNKLEPLPRFEMIPATDPFRVLERGNNDAGTRALGTDFRIAGGGIVLHKTRLNDPTLWFMGTNETGGDFRNSGCTACHVAYANDRTPANSGPALADHYKNGGASGYSASKDKNIPHNEPGHPVAHRMTRSVPISQCLTCHHHQGNGALGNYVGAMWWDQESDANKILSPGAQRDEQISAEKRQQLYPANPSNSEVQIADWHGHSWNFRYVYKMDRHGNLLDAAGNKIDHSDPKKFEKAVHLQDIHLEKGMHCIDCHTEQDVHGDGRLWGTMIDPIEIRCEDCHGTIKRRAGLVTSGLTGGNDLADRRTGARTPFGQRQFQVDDDKIIQRSKMDKNLQWVIPQVVELDNPQSSNYNAKAARAHTLRRDGVTWAKPITDMNQLAHNTDKIECYTCHSAWNTNCYGCHLSAEVNTKADVAHYEGETTRAYVAYNPMVLRADAFLLGIGGTAKGNKLSPMRSASAVFVSARDRGRNMVVHQQPTISAPGYSGFAVTPNPPHTVRTTETKQCTDCHVSEDNDNNAWLASSLGMGSNAVNFIGEYAYVAAGNAGIQAVQVTEGLEPQPVIGSNFHRILYPESHQKFVETGRQLKTAHSAGSSNARSIEARGEFVFVADGRGGFKVFDRANIANKKVAQPLVENQNSRFGQKTSFSTKDATCVALPSTVPMNLDRPQLPENLEAPVPELFRYAYITDRYEGLIIVDVNTLHDANPDNNYIKRTITYNPDNRLAGAVKIRIAGNYAYIISETTGLHIVDISKPRVPQWVANVGAPNIVAGRSVAIQFRYAFVVDQQGFKVVDITEPRQPRVVSTATIPLADGRDLYLMRTYAYVAAGSEGLAIIDIEKPEAPKLVEKYSANGQMSDANAVTTSTVNASTFAFVADGKNGLRVARLIEPPDTPGHLGFSPRPTPLLIATYKTKGPALAVAEGAKRDRPTDEDGNQIGVGGRLGSRPLNKADMDKMLRREGKVFTVRNF